MNIDIKTIAKAVIVTIALPIGVAIAQTQKETVSPYSGEQARQIKALSEKDINDYLTGQGMGYAKAAELNNYPGPRHVLDLAKSLSLSPEQTKSTNIIYDSMKAHAIALGKLLVEKESQLDHKFATASMERDDLNALTAEIGIIEANIRQTHLAAHIEQKSVLSEDQVQLYNRLRGYTASSTSEHRHAH